MSKNKKPIEVLPEIDSLEEETIEIKVPSFEIGIVTCKLLNVRKEPSTVSEILSMIHKDTEVKILEDINEVWYRVRVSESITGFCMKEFIKVSK